MQHASLFISIKPAFVSRIFDGRKTIELRRVRPNVLSGNFVLIYSSSPVMALLGSARVEEVLSGPPCDLWARVKDEAGVTRQEYESYFSNAAVAVGIRLARVQRLARPIALEELRRRWPWLRPPQSYRYVNAQFEHDGSEVSSIAPPP
jgi:predicted transcriptional regulator